MFTIRAQFLFRPGFIFASTFTIIFLLRRLIQFISSCYVILFFTSCRIIHLLIWNFFVFLFNYNMPSRRSGFILSAIIVFLVSHFPSFVIHRFFVFLLPHILEQSPEQNTSCFFRLFLFVTIFVLALIFIFFVNVHSALFFILIVPH